MPDIIEKYMRKLYFLTLEIVNSHGSKYKSGTNEVKRQLYQSFCANLYCCEFWYETKKGGYEKLGIAYNNCFCRIM